MDDDLAEKEFVVRPLDPETYGGRDVCLTIFQVIKVQNPLLAVLRKHEDELLDPLRAKSYGYRTGLMAVVSPSSRQSDAVSVDSVLQHSGKERFFKNSFLLAFSAGLHHRLCIRNLATS